MTEAPETTPRSALVTLDETRRLIDAYLGALFAERIKQARHISPDYAQLWQTIATLSAAGGKRLRPYMTLLSYTMDDETRQIDDILPAAAAQELLHLALLIHDDIIDRDDRRYGIKNITGEYNELYKKHITDATERRHFSSSAAIIAGDLLISEAHRLIPLCIAQSARIAKAQGTLATAIFHVAGGELLDTESSFRPLVYGNALRIAEQKTASYSFVGPLIMGAQLAGASAQTVTLLNRFGNALGAAYQLQDDLLGVFGDEKVTGKSTSSDIVEGKHTYLVEQFYQLADVAEKRHFAAIFKNPQASAAALHSARQLLENSGAKRATEQAIDELARAAQHQLAQLSLTSHHKSAFSSLVKRSTHRHR